MNYKTTEQNSTVNLPEQNSTASSPENNSTGPVVSQPVCRDFNRGYCPRGDHCRRIHTTAICWMYLRDSESCNASNCAFVHKSMSDILEMEESEAVSLSCVNAATFPDPHAVHCNVATKNDICQGSI